jgi:hypothetical protein
MRALTCVCASDAVGVHACVGVNVGTGLPPGDGSRYCHAQEHVQEQIRSGQFH